LQSDTRTSNVTDGGGNVLEFGRRANAADYLFNGLIDEVRIYNRALSAGEIGELYRSGAERLVKVNMPENDKLTGGLVGFWSFNGQSMDWGANTATDDSPNSNTGTMTNMSTTTSPVPGVVGQALTFDGTDDYVDAGNPASLNIVNAGTVSAWIYMPSVPANGVYWGVAGKYDGSTHRRGYGLLVRGLSGGAKLFFNLGDDSSGQEVVGSTVMNANQWYHLVGTWDGSNITGYVDGNIDVGPTTQTITPVSDVRDMLIGAADRLSTPFRFYDGTIDEARVYDRALSASEITELYSAGKARIE
jgi:hypothetical protein